MNFCLGLSGQKQVGKDTVCNIIEPLLSKNFEKQFERIAFADAVKQMLCNFYYIDEKTYDKKRVTRDWIEDNKEKNDYIPQGWNMNVREGLTNIGDRFREICPNVWIDIALYSAKQKNKIITDIRYKNEAKLVYEQSNGLVIRIMRPGHRVEKGNRSETDLNNFDKMLKNNDYEGPVKIKGLPYNYVLQNDGDMKKLKEKVQTKLISFILSRWKYFIKT